MYNSSSVDPHYPGIIVHTLIASTYSATAFEIVTDPYCQQMQFSYVFISTQIWNHLLSRDSSVVIVTWYWLGCDFRQRKKIFSYSTDSRSALGPSQPPVERVPGALSSGAKQPGLEAGHSPLSNVEVRNVGAIHQLPHTSSWTDAWIIKHRDIFFRLLRYSVYSCFFYVVYLTTNFSF